MGKEIVDCGKLDEAIAAKKIPLSCATKGNGLVFVSGPHAVGSMITVRVTEATEYDLWADSAAERRPLKKVGPRTRPRRIRRGNRPLPMAIQTGT